MYNSVYGRYHFGVAKEQWREAGTSMNYLDWFADGNHHGAPDYTTDDEISILTVFITAPWVSLAAPFVARRSNATRPEAELSGILLFGNNLTQGHLHVYIMRLTLVSVYSVYHSYRI